MDAVADEVNESARPGSTVGVTLSAPELQERGTVSFSLPDSAGGRFAIGPTSGVVTLLGAVDYEASPAHSIVARARTSDGNYFAERRLEIVVVDSSVPALSTDFPSAHASYSHSVIGLSVGVTHPLPQNIDVVATAGMNEVTGNHVQDGRFLLEGLSIPPGEATFTIQVQASHAGGESVEASITVSTRPDLSSIAGVALDPGNDRLLLSDRYTATILSLSLATFELELLSGPDKGAGPPLVEAGRLALDSDSGTIYVVDYDLHAVFRIAQNGDRTVLSDRETGTGDTLLRPTDIVFDSSLGELFVSDDGRNAVVSVDRVTGDRAVISSASVGAGPVISSYRAMDLDASRNRLLLAQTRDVVSIDLATGARAVMSPGDVEPDSISRTFSSLSTGTTSGIAYLSDTFSNAVVRLNLLNGQRDSVSSSGLGGSAATTHPVIGSGPRLEFPNEVVFDETANRVFVIEEEFADPLIEIDLDTGDRAMLSDGSVGDGVNFRRPGGISLDAANRIAYIVDSVADTLVAVDLESGDRQLLAGDTNGRGTIDTAPLGVAHGPDSGEILVADFTLNSLYAVDPLTGLERVISDATVGSGPLLENPDDTELAPDGDVAYVIDSLADAVFAVDLATGARQIVSLIGSPKGLDLDADNGRLFVSDSDCIYTVDLSSGERNPVSCNSMALGQGFRNLSDIAWDSSNDRVLAIDDLRNALFSVDVATGNREIISGDSSLVLRVTDPATGVSDFVDVPRVEGGGIVLAVPRKIDLDTERQIAYITDDAYDGIIAVDVTSGYRQLIAK